MSLFDLLGKKRDNADQEGVCAGSAHSREAPVKFGKIMVVVDGSAASLDAVDYSLSLAMGLEDCKLCAAFVVDTASMDLLLQMHIFVGGERSAFEEELETKGRRTLEFVRGRADSYGLDVDTFLLKGRAAQSVLKAVRELDVDLLVVGGWHDGSTRKDTSSVEYQLLLDQADCPVMVIKHKSRGGM
jgi:nucleotide-binding universal stress UspA family protein